MIKTRESTGEIVMGVRAVGEEGIEGMEKRKDELCWKKYN